MPTRTIAPNPLARLGLGLWRLLTSVDFAVVQIIFLGLLAAVGMTIRQLPDFAFRSASDYAAEMDRIHLLYDPLFGTAGVGALERLGVFQMFRSPWFSAGLLVLVISIVVCTLDRIPRLWRSVSDVRVVQPDPFYDPRLPERAALAGVPAPAVRAALRRRGFRIREGIGTDGALHLNGDRHQYTKLATLLTHLGLILFLAAAAVSARFGDEQGLVVAEDESLTVQPIGTPGLLLVKNLGFEAPGLETGMASDFTTDLAVFQDGREIARKTIRVNDPLSIAGYTFHQNGFGAAPHLIVRDAEGRPLWDGKVPLVNSAGGLPYGTMGIPGRDLGLQVALERLTDGEARVIAQPYRIAGIDAEGEQIGEFYAPADLLEGERATNRQLGISIELVGFNEYTLLIAGLAITFYLPRRRVWARLAPDGRLVLVWRSDRYVNVEREFGGMLEDLVAARRPA